MKSLPRLILVFLVACTFVSEADVLRAQTGEEPRAQPELRPEDKLVILWTSGERDVAHKLVFMYALNSLKYGWWDDITLIVWGPSARLLSEDTELQEQIQEIGGVGVKLEACKVCTDMYEASEKLESLGVEVKYMGSVLTDYIKEGRHVLTF